MSMSQPPPEDFPGTLYDGNGMRLAGSGPEFTQTLGGNLPFQIVLRSRRATDEGVELRLGDRIWLLPDTLGTPPELPEPLLHELAGIIRAGGTIGLAAGNEAVGILVRDTLLLLLEGAEDQSP